MDAAAKGGRWDWTLTVLSSMGRWRLAPDIFNYNIAISEASHWQQSLQLQGCRESGRAPNGITYSNSLTTLAAHGCWKFALCMSRRSSVESSIKSEDRFCTCASRGMRTDRCHSDAWLSLVRVGAPFHRFELHAPPSEEIACGAALNACEKGLQWRASLMMLRCFAQTCTDTDTPCPGHSQCVVVCYFRMDGTARHGDE